MHTAAFEDARQERRSWLVVRAARAEADTRERRLGPGLDVLHRREPTMRELSQDQFLLERRAIALEPVELEARPQPQRAKMARELRRVVGRRRHALAMHVVEIVRAQREPAAQRLAIA